MSTSPERAQSSVDGGDDKRKLEASKRTFCDDLFRDFRQAGTLFDMFIDGNFQGFRNNFFFATGGIIFKILVFFCVVSGFLLVLTRGKTVRHLLKGSKPTKKESLGAKFVSLPPLPYPHSQEWNFLGKETQLYSEHMKKLAEANKGNKMAGTILATPECDLKAGFSFLQTLRDSWENELKLVDFCVPPQEAEVIESGEKCWMASRWSVGGESEVGRKLSMQDSVSNHLCVASHVVLKQGDTTEDGGLLLQGGCKWVGPKKKLTFMNYQDDQQVDLSEFDGGLPPFSQTPPTCDFVLDDPLVVFRPAHKDHINAWYVHVDMLGLLISLAVSGVPSLDKITILVNALYERDGLLPIHDLYSFLSPNQDVLYPDTFFSSLGGRRARKGCARQVLFPYPSGQVFLHGKTPCGPSAILHTYADVLLGQAGVEKRSFAREQHEQIFRITVVKRGAGMMRMIANDIDLVNAVVIKDKGVESKLVNLAELPLKEQIRVVHSTDLLIGAHGASLFWQIVLPPCGRALEIGATGAFAQQFDFLHYWADTHFSMIADAMNIDALVVKSEEEGGGGETVFPCSVPIPETVNIVNNEYIHWKYCMAHAFVREVR